MKQLSEQKMKNLIAKKYKETNIPIQQLYNLYATEQIVKKLSESKFKDHLILKGGYLLSMMYGLNERSTKDLDTTVQHLALNEKTIDEMITFIETPEEDGKQYFKFLNKRETRQEFIYNGYNLNFMYQNGKTKFKVDLDLTTGEDLLKIIPKNQTNLLFEEKTIDFPGYPIEQILVDKYYTMLAYGTDGTRAKDYYDMYLIPNLSKINYKDMHQMLKQTLNQRESDAKFYYGFKTIYEIENSEYQKNLWNKWSDKQPYAKNIPFETVVDAMRDIYNHLKEANNYFRENEPEKIMPYTPADKLMQQTLIKEFAVNEDENTNESDLNDDIDLDI